MEAITDMELKTLTKRISRKVSLVGLLFILIFSPVAFRLDQTGPIENDVAYAQSTLPTCSGTLNDVHLIIGTNTYMQDSNGPVGTTCQLSPQEVAQIAQQGATQPPGGGVCTWYNPATWVGGCFLNPLLNTIGLMFLTVGGAVLELAGLLFDTLIQAVITGFGSTLQTLGIIGAITTGWDAMRDLSNILIIGMFVFIAISTILGSKEYGYKKLVSRVLIIAVLMNFSLLFTKLIIDASNFTAYQFYKQITGGSQTTTNSGTCATSDIACAFMQPMGITSIYGAWQTGGAGTVVGKANVKANDDGWTALLAGMIGGILLVVVGLVLFYGVILIGARAVVLVVLMLTSSVAFATYLIPNFAESPYGWKGWWKALINCAIFAPLLMLFLSISLLILHHAPTLAADNTLGAIINNPSKIAYQTDTWEVIMTYLFTIGLLFVSFKISSQFATMASGVNIASMVTGRIPGLAGILGQQTIGRFGLGMSRRKADEANAARDLQEKAERSARTHTAAGNTYLANFAKDEAERQKKIAARKISSAGRYGAMADAKFGAKTSLSGRIDERAKAGAKIAEKLAPHKEDNDRVRKDAIQQANEIRQGERGKIDAETAAAKVSMDDIKGIVEGQKKGLQAALREATNSSSATEDSAKQNKGKSSNEHDAIIAELSKKIAEKTVAGGANPAEMDALKQQRERRISERDAEFKAEDRRINEAREKVAAIQTQIEKADKSTEFTARDKDGNILLGADGKERKITVPVSVEDATAQYKAATEKLTKFNKDTEGVARKAGQDAVHAYAEGVGEVAAEIGKRQGGIWTRMIGAATGDNKRVGDAAKKKYMGSHGKDANLKKAIKDAAKEEHEEEAAEKKSADSGSDDH